MEVLTLNGIFGRLTPILVNPKMKLERETALSFKPLMVPADDFETYLDNTSLGNPLLSVLKNIVETGNFISFLDYF
jgi:hypothetical protein